MLRNLVPKICSLLLCVQKKTKWTFSNTPYRTNISSPTLAEEGGRARATPEVCHCDPEEVFFVSKNQKFSNHGLKEDNPSFLHNYNNSEGGEEGSQEKRARSWSKKKEKEVKPSNSFKCKLPPPAHAPSTSRQPLAAVCSHLPRNFHQNAVAKGESESPPGNRFRWTSARDWEHAV